MRTRKVLLLLAEQEHKFERERQMFRDERERLLDRLMILVDKPPYPLDWSAGSAEVDADLMFPDQEISF